MIGLFRRYLYRHHGVDETAATFVGMDYFLFVLLCGFAAFCFSLGLHGGNSMQYAYHLLSPWLFIVAFSFVSQLKGRAAVVALMLVAVDLSLFLVQRPPIPHAHAEIWAQWRALIAPQKLVYAPPPLADILREQGKPVFDTGLSEYFGYSPVKSIYPRGSILQARYDEYVAGVARRVDDGLFDMIILPYDQDQPLFCFIPTNRLTKHYEPVGELDLPMEWEPVYRGVIFQRRNEHHP